MEVVYSLSTVEEYTENKSKSCQRHELFVNNGTANRLDWKRTA